MADGQQQASVDLLPAIATVEISPPYGPRDITRSFLRPDGRLWNEDMVLMLEAGNDLRQYKDLLRDDHVKSTFMQRTSAVTAAAWSVQPGMLPGETEPSAIAQEAADFVTANLERIGFDDITTLALYAVFYGFSVSEILWDVVDWKGSPKFQWKAIKPRDRSRFLFTPAGRCYLNTGKSDTDPDRIWCDATPENPYFWIVSTGEDHGDNPYGLGLAHNCFWLVRFKRDTLRWWMVYNEKYASPTVVGTAPPGADAVTVRAPLLRAIAAVLTQGGVVVPNNCTLETLEAKRQGSSDYKTFIDTINEAISKIIIGQTLTTQVGDSGSRALGDVHQGVATTVQKADGDLICESLNRGPIAWLVERNFGKDCPKPKVRREIEEKTDLTELVTQLTGLDSIGFRPTLEFVQDAWGADFEDLGPPPSPLDVASVKLGAQPGKPGAKPGKPGTKDRKAANDAKFMAAFAAALPRLFPDQTAIDGALGDFGARMAELSSSLLMPIVDYVDSKPPVEILTELQQRGEFNAWKDEDLRDAVAQVIFVAKTFGRSFGGRA